MYVVTVIGGIFYVSHFPEKLFPGKMSDNLTCWYTLLLLLLTGTIFSYFCMSSITSVLILAILIAIVLF